MTNFKPRQKVAIKAMGMDWKWNWDEIVTVVDGKGHSVSPTSGDWYLIRFADGGKLNVHETRLRPA